MRRQQIWANMLANATDPRHLTPVGPIFASMLRDLGSREVAFLEVSTMTQYSKAGAPNAFFSNASNIIYLHHQLFDFYKGLGIELDQDTEENQKQSFFIMLDILRKHEIIHEAYAGNGSGQPTGGVTRLYHVTNLEDGLAAACRPPKSTRPPGCRNLDASDVTIFG